MLNQNENQNNKNTEFYAIKFTLKSNPKVVYWLKYRGHLGIRVSVFKYLVNGLREFDAYIRGNEEKILETYDVEFVKLISAITVPYKELEYDDPSLYSLIPLNDEQAEEQVKDYIEKGRKIFGKFFPTI